MSDERGPATTDQDLILAVRGGDATALRSLYDRHARWLTIRLARRCADPAIVEEVVQDTFLAVWRGAGRYRGQGEVAAWIWGIAIRRCEQCRFPSVPNDAPAESRRH